MVNISMPKKIDEGNSGFLGDLGKIAGIAAPIVSVIPGGQIIGAGLAAASGLNALSAKQGSVEQQAPIGSQKQGAMQRRLQDVMAPSQLQAPQMPMQAQYDPNLEALKRRYQMMG